MKAAVHLDAHHFPGAERDLTICSTSFGGEGSRET